MRQIPPKHVRGTGIPRWEDDTMGWSCYETNTDWVNKHATEYAPPLGRNLHLHLVYSHTVHWRVVTRGSHVCRIPGRCHKVDVFPQAAKAKTTWKDNGSVLVARAPGW